MNRLTEEMAARALSEAGHRLTATRRIILALVLTTRGHFSAAEVWERARHRRAGIGRATVFRALELFTRVSLLGRVHLGEGAHQYVLCRGGHHHHLVCLECGSVVDFAECFVPELGRVLSEKTRYRIHGHWLEVFGRCPACQGARPRPAEVAP